MKENNCEHGYWESGYVEHYNHFSGEMESEFERDWISTEEDIDLHRTKCSMCGEIGYYSGAAKDWYEKGISANGIPGLG